MPELRIFGPPGSPAGDERSMVLSETEYVIGRDPTSAILLTNPKVSRRHARIYREGSAYWVEDLGSSNGVIIGGVPISSPRQLVPGTQMDIGPFTLTVHGDGADEDKVEFRLVGLNDTLAGQTFELSQGRLQVGRVEGNALVIAHNSVSRQHAVVTVTGGSVTVEDLDSSNGTYVDGKRIRKHVITPGSIVRFGSIDMMLEVARLRVGLLGRMWTAAVHADGLLKLAVMVGGLALVLGVVVVVLVLQRQQQRPAGRPAVEPILAVEQDPTPKLKALLAEAQGALAQQQWNEAAELYERARALAPDDAQVNAGRLATHARLAEQHNLQEAHRALTANQPERALELLAAIASHSPLAVQADKARRAAESSLADRLEEQAAAACKTGSWAPCHQAATKLVRTAPERPLGAALIRESENALRIRKLPFTPIDRDAKSAEADAELLRTYADADVREIVLRYASGDLESACKRARGLPGKTGLGRLATQLNDLRRVLGEADKTAKTGDSTKALRLLESVLNLDGRLLPAGHPSVVRRETQVRIGKLRLERGEAAFGRADYSHARNEWLAGLRIAPQNDELLRSLGKLDTRAKALLEGVQAQSSLDSRACGYLKDVSGMTDPGSALGQKARLLMAKCP